MNSVEGAADTDQAAMNLVEGMLRQQTLQVVPEQLQESGSDHSGTMRAESNACLSLHRISHGI